jgi:hypothetical protein
MYVYSFQLQLRTRHRSAAEILHEIDPQAPIPEALEGGDGHGPLYECILDVEKEEALVRFCSESGEGFVYTSLHKITLNDLLYQPEYYVQWRFGKDTTVSSSKN